MRDHEVNLNSVTTWVHPALVSIVILVTTVSVFPHDRESSLVTSISPILCLLSLTLLDFLPQTHPSIFKVTRATGRLFVGWLFYSHLFHAHSYAFWTSIEVFLLSCAVLGATFMFEKQYQKNTMLKLHLPKIQIITTALILCVPNPYALLHHLSLWEIVVRIFIFTITSWVQLISNIAGRDNEICLYHFFNRFWWIFVVHKLLIPAIAVVWVNSVLSLSSGLSAREITKQPEININIKHALIEEKELPSTIPETHSPEPVVPTMSATVSTNSLMTESKTPTTLFTGEDEEAQPQRALRKKWRGGSASTKPVSRQQQRRLPQQLQSSEEQLKKLQRLAAMQDAV